MSRYTHTAQRLRCQHGDVEPRLDEPCEHCDGNIGTESDGQIDPDGKWWCDKDRCSAAYQSKWQSEYDER